MTRTLLRVTGTVQGVGFRPFVYRHAVALGLAGSVRNDSAGVLIDVEGEPEHIAELTRVLTEEAPPLARVATVTVEDAAPRGERDGFSIVESDASGSPSVPVSVDTATCDDCLAEVDDPADRRYRYPFTNCTNCGPRYTIVLSVPYDRPATTMRGFAMCPACRAEYDDPSDRRFHAQPNACPECGPQLTWRDPTGQALADGDDALTAAVDALRDGAVVAVKGIGGYHLAVDATNADAVRELRRRKARDDKPFAVMVPDLDAAHALCELDEDAVAALAVAAPPHRARAPPSPVRPSPMRWRPGFPTSACSCPTRRCTTCLLARCRSSARDDERQQQRRADRARRRRRGDAAGAHGRRPADPRPRDPHPLRRLGRSARPEAGCSCSAGHADTHPSPCRCRSRRSAPCSRSAPS